MFELIVGAVSVFAAVSILTGVRLLQEYERAVIFRLGRAKKQLAHPGLNFLLPWGIDRARVVDIRTKAIQIPPQEVITHDNISISVDAVVYASVASPSHAVLEVEQFMPATLQLAATTLRAVLGKMELDEILAHRDRINNEIRTILDTRTEQWGVEISAVEIKDIQLPREMQRAMARQAEAERERRAKVIAAEGEVQAAAKLAEAAAIIAGHPGALQLRLYQTLVEVSGQASSTIVFPVPIDLSGGGVGAASTQQIQGMMQSAVALASSEKAKQLAAAQRGDQLEGGKRAGGRGVRRSVRPGAAADKLRPRRRPSGERYGARTRTFTRTGQAQPLGTSTVTSPSLDQLRLAGQPHLGDEVDVAQVLALVAVERAQVRLARDDLHAAQAAGRLADARGGDRDLRSARGREHRVADRAFDPLARRHEGDRRQGQPPASPAGTG